ncbi:MAG: 4a-hydroxytetrahydrobiopterin dehydratase [Verrucomicrobia bacterium]|nr:4a-hydroxytetrahydrobiopterin dehydratase [Verrucomicrobiota bacterium]MBS0636360.1 4a-hydroxytetrahydrobiopterin dehydratase [Verrucomicrobiota bacterium]
MNEHCTPCHKVIPALDKTEIDTLLQSLNPHWKVVPPHHLTREYTFKNFKEALDFTVRVGELAEAEGHHPDIALSWGKVIITLWTHKINGLSHNDFILARKIDAL